MAVDFLVHQVEGAVLHAHAEELDDAGVAECAHHFALADKLGHLRMCMHVCSLCVCMYIFI